MNTLFKALSDPTRRAILELLVEKDMTAGEIHENFEISKPSITHHLNMLFDAELVLREKSGQHVIYSLNTTVFQEVMKWIFTITDRGDEK